MMSAHAPRIPVARPWMGREEIEAVGRVIASGWVTQGPEVAAFERELAAYVGSRHACAVANGTCALHLALRVVGVGPGDEVITVSHSFVATANVIRHCGATPVFVDIEPSTYNMDPSRIEAAITPRTRAILCVHQIGMPCDVGWIVRIARRHDLAVVEDAACAIGSEVRWRDGGAWERIGKPHGDLCCFSFHPRKLLTTGEGGMITTARRKWDTQLRLWRHHGMSIADAARHSARRVEFESYLVPGYNYRMSDIHAAVGRQQLRRLPALLARRRSLVMRYRRRLAHVPGLRLPQEPDWARSNWQSFCVRLPPPPGTRQRRVMQTLLDAGIATRRGVQCAHREPAYPRGSWSCPGGGPPCECRPGTCRQLIESERAQDECIVLPLFHTMTEHDQDAVVEALRRALRRPRSG